MLSERRYLQFNFSSPKIFQSIVSFFYIRNRIAQITLTQNIFMKNLLRFITVLLAVCCCTGITAQNLVLNPSFEQTSACPQGISQFNLATNWAQGNSGADSCSTSDLYAGCVPQFGGSNSPNGLLGYQASRTGDHHAGIILAEGFLGCTLLGDNYREYIEGTLSSPLVAGQKYLVRFYVSLPEQIMGGSDDLGVYFSNSYYSHNACQGQLMPVTPQLNYCGPCLMDTVGWTEVRWIYTATGGETYLTIGNFKNDGNTTLCPLNCSGFTQNPYIYYYIDDVEVSPVGPNDCAFALTTLTTKAGCPNNDGTATITAAGCTTPFQYAWSTGGSNATITSQPAGNYTVTVTDNTNCSSTISAIISQYTSPVVQLSSINASCTANNGTVIANPVGTGPFSYQWNTNANTQVLNNLGAGTYSVTVTGAGACTATASATITASAGSLQLTGSSTPASCGNNNGTATVTASGGSGPYTYLWSNSQTTQTISNLAPGNYLVTVTPNTTATNTAFYSEDFTSGQGGWTFADGPGTNGAQPNQWVVNSDADCTCSSGNYLHVTCNPSGFTCLGSQGSCTYFPGIPIPNPLIGDPTTDKMAISPAISTVGKTNMVLSFKYIAGGDPNIDYGQVRFSADGGSSWTNMPTQYSSANPTCSSASISIPNNFENIANFKIAFRWINNNDGNGDDPGWAIDSIRIFENSAGSCPSTTSVTVTGSNTLSLNATSTSANCGQNNGTASVAVSGTGNFTYTWSNGGNAATISNLAGGTYTVTVNAGGNCSATASTTVSATTGLSITTNTNNATCGNNNGSAVVNVSGTGNYTYSWSNGANTSAISNLAAGTYNVTVSQTGCSATASAVVVASAGLTANFSVTQPSCGQNNGILNCTVINGATQPVSTSWSLAGTTISTNTQISNLGSGTYTFHATDATNCSLDTSFTLSSNGTSNPVITSNHGTICASDSAQICAPAGYVSYLWNTGATGQCITAKQAGNYYVTVTDAGNCTASSNHLALNVYPQPPVSISVNGDSLLAYNSVTYQWYLNGQPIAGATNPLWIATQSGSYTVVVSDANGCTAQSLPVLINVTGIKEIAEAQVNIYPNPLQEGNWNLEVNAPLLGSKIEVFDAEGRLVYRNEIVNQKSEIIMNAARGVYMLRISSSNNTISRKLIKL